MRKNLNKIIAIAMTLSLCSGVMPQKTFAEPSEVMGNKTVKKWDYHKTNYDKEGNIRYMPGTVQFDTENEGGQVVDNRIPQLTSEDALYGENIEISFDESTVEAKQWKGNIYKISKVDSLTGNPNLESHINFKVEDGKIILLSDSTAIDYNDMHKIKIYSSGYAPAEHVIHIVKNSPEIRIHPDFKPFTNQDILFELVNFNYRIKNPIYEVKLDGKVLKGDCEDYHVVSNLIRLENTGRIQSTGVHKVEIKAIGYKDAVLEFAVREGEGENNPVNTHEKPEVEVITPAKVISFKEVQNNNADVISGATTGTGNTGGVDTGSGASATASLDMNANLIFDFDLISNAYILRELGMETENSKKVLEIWESTTKDAAISKETGRVVSWSGYTNAVEKAKVKGEHITFEDYIKNPDAEDYVNKPYNVKYVLEDGLYGEVQGYNEIMMKESPKLTVNEKQNLGEDLIITFNTDEGWQNNIGLIKVGNTTLRESEYKVENGKLTIKGYTVGFGDNRVLILSEGYKNVEVQVFVEKEPITLSVEGEAKLGENVVIKGVTEEYVRHLESVRLNGKSLLSEEAAGESGQYKVQMDKIILNKDLFSDTTQQTLIVNAYGYSEKILHFTMKKGDVGVVDPTKDVVPTMKVTETIEGENVVITFDNDNPKWRDAIKKITVSTSPLPVDSMNYSIEAGKITILGKCFRKGENEITIEADGYDTVSIKQVVNEKPAVELEKAFPKFNLGSEAQVGKELALDIIKEENKDYTNWNQNMTVKVNDSELKAYEYEITEHALIIKESVLTEKGNCHIEIIPEGFEKVELNIEIKEAPLKEAPTIDVKPIHTTGDFIIQGSEWTNAINKIIVASSKGDHKELVKDKDYYYDSSNSNFIINGSVFTEVDLVDIIISADGYKESTIKLTVKSRLTVPEDVRISGDGTIKTGDDVVINLPNRALENFVEYKVKEVYIGEEKLDSSKYEADSIKVKIKGDNFTKAGKYTVKLVAPMFEDKSFEIVVKGQDIPQVPDIDAPVLTVDTTDNRLGEDIELTFEENEPWRNRIERVLINDIEIDLNKIKKESGKITLLNNLFSEAGSYKIDIFSDGYKKVSIQQEIKERKPVITTSLENNQMVNEQIFSFTAKANKIGNIENESIIVKVNDTVVEPKSGITYETTLNEGDNIISIEVVGSEVVESFTIKYEKLQVTNKQAPVIEDIADEAGKSISANSEDLQWLQAIKSIELDGEVLPSNQYNVYGQYSGKCVMFESSAFTTAKEYNVVIKSEGYEDCSFKITINALEVPSYVDLVNSNLNIGQEVKIKVKDGFDSKYCKNVAMVIVDNNEIDKSKYTVPGEYSYNEKELIIDSSVFTEAKDYKIVVKADGYEDKNLTVTFNNKEQADKQSPAFNDITKGLGENVDTITDNTEWLSAIKSVELDGIQLQDSSYSISNNPYAVTKYLRLNSSNFSEYKEYNIVVKAEGYEDCSFKVNIRAKGAPDFVGLVNDKVNLGDEVKITVKEDFECDYSKSVYKITVNNTEVDNSKYTIPGEFELGKDDLIIGASVFTEAKDYNIVIKANGYEDKEFTVTFNNEEQPNKPAPVINNIAKTLGEGVDVITTDTQWLSAIKSVELDGSKLGEGDYSIKNDPFISSKSISLNSSNFSEYKEYSLVIKAEGYEDCSLMINIKALEVPDYVDLVNSNVNLGEDIKIKVKGNFKSEYSEAITTVIVNGNELEQSKYTKPDANDIRESDLTINNSVFTEAKDYNIVIKANGYEEKDFTVTINN